MDIKADLLNALKALAPEIDRTKALLELDTSASAVSRPLSEPQGLALIEYIIEELECGKKPVYWEDRFLERTLFDQLIVHFYLTQEQGVLDTLLPLYHQSWLNARQENSDPRAGYETLTRLVNSDAVTSKTMTLKLCLDCCLNLEAPLEKCDKCGKSNLLTVYRLSLSRSARAVMKNGQYLEIYVKECMRQSGIELIGWDDVDKRGSKAYTNIRYQVEGEKIDIDVHGITRPFAILLCEVKTSKKITMNELRRVENLFDRLIGSVHDLCNRKINHLKLFIVSGEFDQNVSLGAYRRKNWELMDRKSIPDLTQEFKRIQSEL